MLVQIDSWFGGGKSLLTGLLDGHPELFTFLYHDASYMALLGENNNADWVLTKHTEQLRRLLGDGCSNYYAIERMANQGFQAYDFSSKDRINLNYPVNYYKFDSRFFKELLSLSDWTLEKIVHVLYKNLLMELTKFKKIDKFPKYFVSQSFPILQLQKNFLNVYPSAKSILVKRKIQNIIATRTNRKPVEDDFQSKKGYAREFKDILKSLEIEKISEYYEFWEEMEEQFPKRVLVVDFDEINMNTESTLKRVAEFLEIKFEEILLKWSYFGEEIKCNGQSYVGRELDDPKKLLSNSELEIINKRIKRFHKFKKFRISSSIIKISRSIAYSGYKIREYGY